jgi:hypothetical protein
VTIIIISSDVTRCCFFDRTLTCLNEYFLEIGTIYFSKNGQGNRNLWFAIYSLNYVFYNDVLKLKRRIESGIVKELQLTFTITLKKYNGNTLPIELDLLPLFGTSKCAFC